MLSKVCFKIEVVQGPTGLEKKPKEKLILRIEKLLQGHNAFGLLAMIMKLRELLIFKIWPKYHSRRIGRYVNHQNKNVIVHKMPLYK